MAISVAQAFEKRHVTREDGVTVLPRPLIGVAALEAGYYLPTPMVDDAVDSTTFPGQMTSEEFEAFCEAHADCFVTPQQMAQHVVVVAPSGIITRGSLEKIANRCTTKEGALSEAEIDTLFDFLDADNKSTISADDLMRALYSEEGALCLAECRKEQAEEARLRLAKKREEDAAATASQAIVKEEELARQEEAELKQREEEEKTRKETEAKAAAQNAQVAGTVENVKKTQDKDAKEKKPEPRKEKTNCCC